MSPPVIYEINTRVWLGELEARYGGTIGLADVPKQAWDEVTPPGIDTVWLMGVWERSPAGLAIAMADQRLRDSFHRVLPDLREADVAGSPYCVRRYVVDARLGGPAGLAEARRELARRGIALMLDYVPNHVAPDHPWTRLHPDYFVGGTTADLERDPASFMAVGKRVFARGRDPYFAPWPDVLQLNALSPWVRKATAEVVSAIAAQCDGIRCDMAMLLKNDVFTNTWGRRAGDAPGADFWTEVIPLVRERHPSLTLMAEVYWDLEWALIQQGFDLCYDKRLYDRLVSGDPESVRRHLTADIGYQNAMVRFLENHDEPRAADALGLGRARAAAVLISTLPGALLLHEGQFEGRRVRVPVFLGRRPDEHLDLDLRMFHERLLALVRDHRLREGRWRLLDCTGWPDNCSFRHLVASARQFDGHRALTVVNMADTPAQARVRLHWQDLAGRAWALRDLLTGAIFERGGDELETAGLFVDLRGWGSHLLTLEAA